MFGPEVSLLSGYIVSYIPLKMDLLRQETNLRQFV